MPENISKLLGEEVATRRELSEMVPCDQRTIARWEQQPDGLAFTVIAGRKYYRLTDVRGFLCRFERRPNPTRKIRAA